MLRIVPIFWTLKYQVALLLTIALSTMACQSNTAPDQPHTTPGQPPQFTLKSTEQKRDSTLGTRNVVNYANTGKVSRQYKEINGLIEGQMDEYWPDGTRKYLRQFVAGKQHGLTAGYYPSGELRQRQYFDKGLQIGGDTTFYRSGKIQMVITFANGQRNGPMTRWDESGKQTMQVIYKDNQPVAQ
jgi:antitoxin component YwqK of YwqJK toxin-antitoxin module